MTLILFCTWLSFLILPKCHHNTTDHSSSNTEHYFSSENQANAIFIVMEEEDLGIIFDKNLKFTLHVHQIVMKLTQSIGSC